MSTKVTIGYGDGFHLYKECWEDDPIYLELDNGYDSEGRPKRPTIAIPVEVWEQVRQCKVADTSYAFLSNEELEVKGKELARKAKNRKGKTVIENFLNSNFDELSADTEDLSDLERENEIIFRLSEKRDKDRALLEKIEAFALALEKEEKIEASVRALIKEKEDE